MSETDAGAARQDGELLEAMLQPRLLLSFSSDEVAALAALTGQQLLTVGLAAEATDVDEARADLGRRGVLANGELSPDIAPLWRTITKPMLIATVERFSGQTRWTWIFLIGDQTFAEQIEGSAGWTWSFCSVDQLLFRILLACGFFRHEGPAEVRGADPVPEPREWNVVITTSISRAALELSCADGSWSDDQREPLSAVHLVDRVSTFISPG